MAVSRASVLQSLVLDDSLRQYQSAAVNTVQNLASSFTGIAHALQKQKVANQFIEQGLQKQISETMTHVNDHKLQIEDLKLNIQHALEKWNRQLTEIAQVRSPDQTFDTRLTSLEKSWKMKDDSGQVETVARIDALEEKLLEFEKHATTQQAPYEGRLKDVLQEITPDSEKKRSEHLAKTDRHTDQIIHLEQQVRLLIDRMEKVEGGLSEFEMKTTKTLGMQEVRLVKLEKDSSQLSQTIQIMADDNETKFIQQRKEVEAGFQAQLQMLTQIEKVLDTKADIKIVLDKVSRLEFSNQVKRLMQADDDIASRAVSREEYKNQLMQLKETISQDQAHRQHNIARLANELQKLVQEVAGKASRADLIDVANVLSSFPKVHAEIDNLKMFVEEEIASKQELLHVQENAVNHKQLRKQLDRLLRSLNEEMGKASTPSQCETCMLRNSVSGGNSCLSCASRVKGQSEAERAGSSAGRALPGPTRGGGFQLTQRGPLGLSGPTAPVGVPPLSGGGPGGPNAGLLGLSSGGRKSGASGHSVMGGSGSAMSGASYDSGMGMVYDMNKPQTAPVGAKRKPFLDHMTGTPSSSSSSSSISSSSEDLRPQTTGGMSLPRPGEIGSDGKVYNANGRPSHRLVQTRPSSKK